MVAPTEISVGVSCSAEIGSSMIADQLFTGDQIGSSGCPAPSAGGILANFNWLDKNQLTCVKNQGHRGLCHIFAATSAMEEKIAHDTGNHVNLSEQDFTEHETLIWNNSNFNDAGHAYNDLQDAAANNYQFAYEYQWDYNPSGVSAPDSTPQAPLYCTADYTYCGFIPVAVSGPTSPYVSPGAMEILDLRNRNALVPAIQLALATNTPVIMMFYVTQAFQGAPGGYVPPDFSDLATSVGLHVVHVVGYVSNADLAANAGTAGAPSASGGGYFIIKNSWGCNTGDAGYYYMPVSYLFFVATEVTLVP